MEVAVAPVAALASLTVSKIGTPASAASGCLLPPLPGVTPPTIWVPYANACWVWKVPWLPVMPWQRTLVVLSTRMAISGCPFYGVSDLLGGVGKVVGWHDRQAGLGQDVLAELNVGA